MTLGYHSKLYRFLDIGKINHEVYIDHFICIYPILIHHPKIQFTPILTTAQLNHSIHPVWS